MTPFRAASAAGFALLVSLVSASTLRAEPSPAPQSGFGGDLQVVTLSHVAFVPTSSAQTYLSFCCATDSYRFPTGGPGGFFAPLDAGQMPNGALIERIDVFVRDTDGNANAEMGAFLCRSRVSEDGLDFNGDCSIQATTN